MSKQFAVFDIDGTVTRVSLLQQIVREFVARDQMDVGIARDIENLLHDYRHLVNDANHGVYMDKVVKLFFSAFKKGLKVETYEEVVRSVVNSSLGNTFVYTRELIQTLKQNNFFIIAMSDSELRSVAALSKQLGFDAWVGSVSYVEKDKKFNGEIQSLHQTKTQILNTLIEKFSLEKRGSMAIGDTSVDIGILEAVENPIAFNPTQELFKIAREKGWTVVLERKDMVYGLSFENNQYVVKTVNA